MREAGVESPTDEDRKRFDRRRKGKRTSNKVWHNPHDPDARVGRTPHGRTRMLYKVEHAVDTNSGAIIGARVCSVAGDTTTGPQTLERASETLAQLHDADPDGGPLTGSRVVMDKGYHSASALADYEDCGFVPHIKEPKRGAQRKARAKRKAARAARKQSRRKRKSKARSPREREALHRNGCRRARASD